MQNHEQCTAFVDHWKEVRCPEPVDGRDGGCFCTEHAIAYCRDEMSKALLAGDYELADEYAESLVKLGVRPEEMKLAA